MNINFGIEDLRVNPWPPKDGGLAAQIAFWRQEILREEMYEGETEEFENYIIENNLEDANA